MNREKAESWLKIGLLGAMLTLIGDCLIGAAKFPDGANMIEGYYAIALDMPAWRPILGGLVGFVGICLEFPALMTIYPLIRETMPHGGTRRRGGAPALRRVYVDLQNRCGSSRSERRSRHRNAVFADLPAPGRGRVRRVFYRSERCAVYRLCKGPHAVSQMVLRVQSDDRKGRVQRRATAWQHGAL